MLEDFRRHPEIRACNAGIFGGTDVPFLKEFAAQAFEFLNINKDSLKKINPLGWLVLIYEQYLFSCLARANNKTVTSLFSGVQRYTTLSEFCGTPRKKHYVHAVGSMKRHDSVCENVASQLRLKYPEYYYRIEELIENQII
jgi:hypothetical protein